MASNVYIEPVPLATTWNFGLDNISGWIESIDFSSVSQANRNAVETLTIEGNTLITAPTLTGFSALTTLTLSGQALPTAEVNSVLVQLDALGASNGTVDLSGGTNGAPSGAGLTAKTSLEGKGWTVTVN